MKTLLTSSKADALTIDTSTVLTPAELQQNNLENLHSGVAHFFFMKKGKKVNDPPVMREAYGTLKKETLERILGEYEPKDSANGESAIQASTQAYFDLEAMAFRAYTIENLKGVF